MRTTLVLIATAACAARPTAAPCAPSTSPPTSSPPPPSAPHVDPARALADRVIDAAGGRARLAAAHVVYLRGTRIVGEGGNAMKMVFAEWLGDDPDAPGGDRARVETSFGGESWIEAHRAAGGWLARGPGSVRPELEDQLAIGLATTWRDRLVFHLLDPTTIVKAAPDETIDGRAYPAIAVSRADGGAPTTLVVDPADGRIVRAHWPAAVGGPHTFTATYDDVREIGGVRVPFRIHVVVEDDPAAADDTVLDEVQVGDAAPATHYDRP